MQFRAGILVEATDVRDGKIRWICPQCGAPRRKLYVAGYLRGLALALDLACYPCMRRDGAVQIAGVLEMRSSLRGKDADEDSAAPEARSATAPSASAAASCCGEGDRAHDRGEAADQDHPVREVSQ